MSSAKYRVLRSLLPQLVPKISNECLILGLHVSSSAYISAFMSNQIMIIMHYSVLCQRYYMLFKICIHIYSIIVIILLYMRIYVTQMRS